MPFTVATWNINSVRLRLPIVESFLRDHAPDVLCLQETKCPNDLFPGEALRALGYGHQAVHGQKGYHGVAILSRHPFEDEEMRDFGNVGHARHQSVRLHVGERRIRLHNFYVPAGGDEPDRAINPKFAHKLDFIEELRGVLAAAEPGVSAILVGDLNIAPLESDVWSHKQLLKIVSHTPVETEGLVRAMTDGGWADLMRAQIGDTEKLYTWWSYRAKDWRAADKGRRLDHVWGSPDLLPHLAGLKVLKDARDWDRPSDHVPVLVTLDF
ncbi:MULTISPECIES: exodeoxyribonuclease III [unclassified Aureimonas]|uniref:exodeoxyribonuclease III n=1 Tax=unclassified Aureimonas TaxID=2615206 RepID=UPI000700FADD|nr:MULTISPECIES: exodeoxyribonuclease III [unclassified Aureimonas]KQT61767.1 exodeoxyribonuclease III [Aureimonas sp. Leaf460]KQT65723.1 exodeoxyribonuclease III [Aureimonas sp. Leaf427]